MTISDIKSLEALKKKKKSKTGGRVLPQKYKEEVFSLLEGQKQSREYLIEHLHLIQDNFGALLPSHLQALAAWLRISMSEVYEVATFYAHFRVLDSDDTKIPSQTIRVCNNTGCCMLGGSELREAIVKRYKDSDVRIEEAPCMGRCDEGPVVSVGKCYITEASFEGVVEKVEKYHIPKAHPGISYEDYKKSKGYTSLEQCRKGAISREEVLSMIKESGLRGMGGAGFPTFMKWQAVAAEDGSKYLCINADEGEPGTFKDLFCLRDAPHQFLEGALIAAWFIEATEIIIYLRDEYPEAHEILLECIAELEKKSIVPSKYIEVRRGAGAYICGEESAMIESIEGKRAFPRHRPPYVASKGLWDRPTMVHNVETIHWIPEILRNEKGWFASFGRNDRKGLRRFSVSGRVKNRGVKIAPAGITLRELIDEYCGGMLDGHTLQGYLPGGASGGILPASMDNIPLDFDTLQPYGCFIGSAAVIVFSDKDDVKEIALNMMKFFAHESCGQCTPCRVGTEKAAILMEREHWEIDTLNELSNVMRETSICGLGQAAPNPIDCVIRYFNQNL